MKIVATSASIGKSFIRLGKTLATAESCTGGLLGHRLTQIPGSSNYYLGGVVCYSDRSKTKLLKISAQTFKNHGAVSGQTAKRMAQNVRELFGADYGIGITGIAGPGGGTGRKPVGLVYIALATRYRVSCVRCRFSGKRAQVKSRAVQKTLALLRSRIMFSAR